MSNSRIKTSGWRFSFSVMLPVIVAVLVTVGTAAGFVVWSTAKSDDHALEHETRLVSHILAKEHEYIANEQSDVSPWDDAVTALDKGIDRDWVDENLGAAFYESHSHHRIYVLDPQLRPVYAMRDGGMAPAESVEGEDAAIIRALAGKLQTAQMRSAMDAFENGFGDLPSVSDLAIIEGRPALVGIVPILGESDEVVVQPDRAFFHVAIRFLDEAVANELMEDYLIEGARFSADNVGEGEAALPLKDRTGSIVAWFRWVPDRPGAQLLRETVPAMAGALLVGGAIIIVLMRRLRRSSSELEAARAEAHHRALHDPLTGLANRAGFQERLGQAIAALGRGQSPIALLALDLDKFKQVNDTLGHESGDQLLQQVAQRLQPLLRENDTVARLGGDEFAIIQTGVASVNDSKTLSDRIIAKVSEPYFLGEAQARIGVSIGIALASEPKDGADLPTRADFALYEAKDNGRSQYKVFGEPRTDDTNVLNLPLPANANKVA